MLHSRGHQDIHNLASRSLVGFSFSHTDTQNSIIREKVKAKHDAGLEFVWKCHCSGKWAALEREEKLTVHQGPRTRSHSLFPLIHKDLQEVELQTVIMWQRGLQPERTCVAEVEMPTAGQGCLCGCVEGKDPQQQQRQKNQPPPCLPFDWGMKGEFPRKIEMWGFLQCC